MVQLQAFFGKVAQDFHGIFAPQRAIDRRFE